MKQTYKQALVLAACTAKLHTSAMLRALDSDKILETLELLGRRIRERFPDAGLNKVAAQLLAIGRDTERRAAFVNRPYTPLRLLASTLIVLLMAVVVLGDRKSTRLNSSHTLASRMPSSA